MAFVTAGIRPAKRRANVVDRYRRRWARAGSTAAGRREQVLPRSGPIPAIGEVDSHLPTTTPVAANGGVLREASAAGLRPAFPGIRRLRPAHFPRPALACLVLASHLPFKPISGPTTRV